MREVLPVQRGVHEPLPRLQVQVAVQLEALPVPPGGARVRPGPVPLVRRVRAGAEGVGGGSGCRGAVPEREHPAGPAAPPAARALRSRRLGLLRARAPRQERLRRRVLRRDHQPGRGRPPRQGLRQTQVLLSLQPQQ